MSQPRILINQMSYSPLISNLTIALANQKYGLVGRNGIGKSTLIKLMINELQPTSGSIQITGKIAYVPQTLTFSPLATVASLLGYEDKLNALHRIRAGSIAEGDYALLDDDWNIEERIHLQRQRFNVQTIPYHRLLNTLSGGEITRLLLAKAFLSEADFLLLDEPTNHLDQSAREQLYKAIDEWNGGLIIVSHDRTLLSKIDTIIELTSLGTVIYGGNYDTFEKQKSIDHAAKIQQLQHAKKSLQKAKESIQSSREKQAQRQSYGRELKGRGSMDKVGAGAKLGRSEQSQNQLAIKEERLINQASNQIQSAKEMIEVIEEINIDLSATHVPNGKIILDIEHLYFSYPKCDKIIFNNFNLKIQGPSRIALIGDNGSGKTTLVKLILNELQPNSGSMHIGTKLIRYLDQQASLLNTELSILDNFSLLNSNATANDAYRCLAQFLFRNTAAQKLVKHLSGGEKLRALLACVLMSTEPPQLLILDEPTNHLDLSSIANIESALKNYQGAMIVISHDERFLENIGVKLKVRL